MKFYWYKYKVWIICLSLIIILAITAIALISSKVINLNNLDFSKLSKNTSSNSTADESVISSISSSTATPEPKVPHPLTGEMITKAELDRIKGLNIVPIIVENHYDARPQSGLSDAEVVYEATAEGGITRYLAVFLSDDPKRIGPERSLRTYFASLGSEYKSIVMHHGQNRRRETGSYAFDPNLIDVPNFTSANGIKHSECGGYRDNDGDKKKATEHTLYNTLEIIRKCTGAVNWFDKFEEYKFTDNEPKIISTSSSSLTTTTSNSITTKTSSSKSSSKTTSSEPFLKSAQSIKLAIVKGLGAFVVDWNYDQISKKYLRKVGGKDDIDFNNKKQIEVKNILVIESNMYYSGNSEENAVYYELRGEGKGYYIHDGISEKIVWKKNGWTGRMKIYYADTKNEVEFQRGNFWYEIMSMQGGKYLGSLDIK